MAYRVVILPSAETDLENLDAQVRQRVLRRLIWMSDHADRMIHHRLANMPDDLAGLCRYRVGDYRILYWHDAGEKTLKVYRLQHRREVYRGL